MPDSTTDDTQRPDRYAHLHLLNARARAEAYADLAPVFVEVERLRALNLSWPAVAQEVNRLGFRTRLDAEFTGRGLYASYRRHHRPTG